MSEWISVKEQLPELREENSFGAPQRRVYFVVNNRVMEGYAQNSLRDTLVFFPQNGNGYLIEEVSHWMPKFVPDPPRKP
jgi:hypothetical protein